MRLVQKKIMPNLRPGSGKCLIVKQFKHSFVDNDSNHMMVIFWCWTKVIAESLIHLKKKEFDQMEQSQFHWAIRRQERETDMRIVIFSRTSPTWNSITLLFFFTFSQQLLNQVGIKRMLTLWQISSHLLRSKSNICIRFFNRRSILDISQNTICAPFVGLHLHFLSWFIALSVIIAANSSSCANAAKVQSMKKKTSHLHVLETLTLAETCKSCFIQWHDKAAPGHHLNKRWRLTFLTVQIAKKEFNSSWFFTHKGCLSSVFLRIDSMSKNQHKWNKTAMIFCQMQQNPFSATLMILIGLQCPALKMQ